jgi:hypothetical protein
MQGKPKEAVEDLIENYEREDAREWKAAPEEPRQAEQRSMRQPPRRRRL